MEKYSLRKWMIPVIAVIGVWIVLRYLLPVSIPFLLAALLAVAAEPLVAVLHGKLKFPRAAAAAVGVTVALLIAVLLMLTLCALLIRQLGALAGVLPDLQDTALDGMGALEHWMLTMAQKAPDGVSPILVSGVEGMFSSSSKVLDQVTDKLLSMASTVLKALPDSALGLGTWVLASFMISARLPKIRTWTTAHLPQVWKEKYAPHLKSLKGSLGGWAFAQLKLVGVTFGILSAGFFLLQIAHPLLWAAVICFVDILPILGTGTVLIPWGIICFLQGDTLRAVGLLVLYGVISLMRSVLEPRLVGKQLGLDPLVTLLALYAGYQLWGLIGMVFAPVLAALVVQIAVGPEKRS